MNHFSLRKAQKDEVTTLTEISKAAFDSDVRVGAVRACGPPKYDDVAWHEEMRWNGNLQSFYVEDTLVGGAILFRDSKNADFMYVGRIFIAPSYHRRGYGLELLKLIEDNNPDICLFSLETPDWNTRTNRFYVKAGYKEVKHKDGFVFFEKKRK